MYSISNKYRNEYVNKRNKRKKRRKLSGQKIIDEYINSLSIPSKGMAKIDFVKKEE